MGSRFDGQGFVNAGDVFYPAALPTTTKCQKQEQAGEASGTSPRRESVQRSGSGAYTTSPAFYPAGDSSTAPLVSQIQHNNGFSQSNQYDSQVGQANSPLSNSSFHPQVPGGMFGVLVLPPARSHHRQLQQQAAIRDTDIERYSSQGYSVTRNNTPATESLESRNQAFVPSQRYGPDGGNLFHRANPYFPAYSPQIPGYQRATPVQQQNGPQNGSPFYQSVGNEYTWGSHQEQGRQVGTQGRLYSSPYSSKPSTRRTHNPKSLVPRKINTGSYKETE